LHAGFLQKKQISVGLTVYDQKVFVTKNVSELMFEGYEDDMVTMGITMKSFGDFGEIPYDKVGWFYMVSFVQLFQIWN
jgi:hypothetical protein